MIGDMLSVFAPKRLKLDLEMSWHMVINSYWLIVACDGIACLQFSMVSFKQDSLGCMGNGRWRGGISSIYVRYQTHLAQWCSFFSLEFCPFFLPASWIYFLHFVLYMSYSGVSFYDIPVNLLCCSLHALCPCSFFHHSLISAALAAHSTQFPQKHV